MKQHCTNEGLMLYLVQNLGNQNITYQILDVQKDILFVIF
jgi:hypothetical protein